jgi:hypothetical protein
LFLLVPLTGRSPHGAVLFIPDDLPDDWLLSYYNTQFQAVYLPAARLAGGA